MTKEAKNKLNCTTWAGSVNDCVLGFFCVVTPDYYDWGKNSTTGRWNMLYIKEANNDIPRIKCVARGKGQQK